MEGRFHRSSGFMLLEVIFAIALLSIGLFVLVESVGRCVAAARSIQNYGVAETVLANKSYEFRVEQPQDYLDQEGQCDDYPGFSWSRTFERYEDVEGVDGLWIQTITVYWNERGQPASDSIVEYRYLPDKQR